MKQVKCVVFAILRDNKFLVERRPDAEETDSGKIALPGGHVEHGETIEKALRRECLEELSVEPIAYKFFWKQLHLAGPEMQECHYYMVTGWKGNIRRGESGELAWLSFSQGHILALKADRNAISHLQKLTR